MTNNRIISLCAKKKRRSFPIEEETEEEEQEEEDGGNDDENHSRQQSQPQLPVTIKTVAKVPDGATVGNGSRFRSRLLDNIRGGSS